MDQPQGRSYVRRGSRVRARVNDSREPTTRRLRRRTLVECEKNRETTLFSLFYLTTAPSMVIPPFQNTDRFDFSKFVGFVACTPKYNACIDAQ